MEVVGNYLLKMVFLGAFFLPHGAMILDPNKENLPSSAKNLHEAMKQVTSQIEALNPDLIFLSTPHGLNLSKSFGLYANNKAQGNSEWNEMWKEFSVLVNLDIDVSASLCNELELQKVPVEMICSHTGLGPSVLRWGEVVPLYFMPPGERRYVIMSVPNSNEFIFSIHGLHVF